MQNWKKIYLTICLILIYLSFNFRNVLIHVKRDFWAQRIISSKVEVNKSIWISIWVTEQGQDGSIEAITLKFNLKTNIYEIKIENLSSRVESSPWSPLSERKISPNCVKTKRKCLKIINMNTTTKKLDAYYHHYCT